MALRLALVKAGLRTAIGRSLTVDQLVSEHAQRRGSAAAVRQGAECLSWGDFDAGAQAFAAVLREAGISREPFALVMEPRPFALMAIVAAARVGAIAACIDPQRAGAPLVQALRQSNARHVFADAASLPRVVAPPESAGLTVWGQGDPAELPPHVEPLDAAWAAARSVSVPRHGRAADTFLQLSPNERTAAVLPELVRQDSFVQAATILAGVIDLQCHSRMYVPLPHWQATALFAGFGPAFVVGAESMLASDRPIDDICASSEAGGPTHFAYSREFCRAILRGSEPPASAVAPLVGIGSGLRATDWLAMQRRFGVDRLVELYGGANHRVGLINLDGRPGAVGRPFPFQRRRIRLVRCDIRTRQVLRDERGLAIRCSADEIGELLIRASSNSTDRRRRGAVAYDVVRRGDLYVRTGDLMRLIEDGSYEWIGTLAEAFSHAGADVFPEVLADALAVIPGVHDAVVYPVEEPTDGSIVPMASVTIAEGSEFCGRTFYERTADLGAQQPRYIRVLALPEGFGSLRWRLADLRALGIEPHLAAEPVYVRDDRAGAYMKRDGMPPTASGRVVRTF